jgi:hypothetical protein
MVFLLVNALPSTSSAEVDISSCSLASQVLCCCPTSERHCEMDVWPPHPIPATLFRVLRLHWGGAPQCTGGFLSAGLPYSSFSISDFSRISRFPRKRYPRMPRYSDSAGSFHDSHLRYGRCCLPHSGTGSAPKKL